MWKTLWPLFQWHIQELAGVCFVEARHYPGRPWGNEQKYAIEFLHHHSAQWLCNSVGVSKKWEMWSRKKCNIRIRLPFFLPFFLSFLPTSTSEHQDVEVGSGSSAHSISGCVGLLTLSFKLVFFLCWFYVTSLLFHSVISVFFLVFFAAALPLIDLLLSSMTSWGEHCC